MSSIKRAKQCKAFPRIALRIESLSNLLIRRRQRVDAENRYEVRHFYRGNRYFACRFANSQPSLISLYWLLTLFFFAVFSFWFQVCFCPEENIERKLINAMRFGFWIKMAAKESGELWIRDFFFFFYANFVADWFSGATMKGRPLKTLKSGPDAPI